MRKMRRVTLVLAALVFTIGGVSTGVALVQIYQENNFAASTQLEIAKLDRPVIANAAYTPVKPGVIIGIITIPKLSETYPIVQGTDDKDLKAGVGHYINSVMPGVKDNTVLAGHRDTVFSKIGRLKRGDFIIVKTSSGTFNYSVTRTRIVLANDKTVIVPTPTATLTLSTCYPFYFIGSAPDRYIVSAKLID